MESERFMAALTDAEVPSPITHEKVLVVFSGLLLVMLLAALDSTIVAGKARGSRKPNSPSGARASA
jgi:hypothetical protein